MHLDADYDYQLCREELARRGMLSRIATRGIPAPIQAGRRWTVERSHAWLNAFGKLRWCTERRRTCVVFWLALACVVVIIRRLVRRLVRRAWVQYRWDGRPARPP